MVPEGLEHTSAEDILDMVKSVGFNFIRMLVSHRPLLGACRVTYMRAGDTQSRWSTRSTTGTARTYLWR